MLLLQNINWSATLDTFCAAICIWPCVCLRLGPQCLSACRIFFFMLAIFDWAYRLQVGEREDGAVGHGKHEKEDCWSAGGVERNMQEQWVKSCNTPCGVRTDLFAWEFQVWPEDKLETGSAKCEWCCEFVSVFFIFFCFFPFWAAIAKRTNQQAHKEEDQESERKTSRGQRMRQIAAESDSEFRVRMSFCPAIWIHLLSGKLISVRKKLLLPARKDVTWLLELSSVSSRVAASCQLQKAQNWVSRCFTRLIMFTYYTNDIKKYVYSPASQHLKLPQQF